LKIKELSLVLAMAGSGTRTSDAHNIPKPLIMVKEQPLFSWALKGLPLDLASDLTLITNTSVAKNPDFDRLLKQFVPKDLQLSVEVLDEKTSGQAETVLLGTNKIDESKGLLIFNCDTYISDDFPREFEDWDGILGSFASTNPGMSYLQTDGNRVTKTVEKDVISSQASTGLYYFASKEIFRNAFNNTNHLGETYVAPMYNSMILNGLKVGFFWTQMVIPLGTSDEIETFEKSNLTPRKR
jgi:NDP-sugar pyrophosphorylase family protein